MFPIVYQTDHLLKREEWKHIESPKKKGKKEGFLGRGKKRGGRKRGITVWTRKSAARKAMKVEVRLRDGKEGAQQGLSLSYFHFTVQP